MDINKKAPFGALILLHSLRHSLALSCLVWSLRRWGAAPKEDRDGWQEMTTLSPCRKGKRGAGSCCSCSL